jgi:poly(3-hydroxybutyrate) depolymerase
VHNVACDGVTYDVAIPSRCITRACGLIVDVHGGTMSGPMEDKNTNLSALGNQHGYIVITPSAAVGLWNAATDDTKVFAFLNTVKGALHADPDRVHITGMSQGGYMSWRFLCQHTEVFASIAPAAAAGAANISPEVGCTFTGQDVPSREIDLLYMHGTADALVNFPNAVTLRDAVLAHYRMESGVKVAGDTQYTRTRYTAPGGHIFEFIQHDYVSDSAVGIPPLGIAIKGHCFPGSDDQTITLPNQLMAFGCKPPTAFDWGEEVMKFFIAHPRR